MYSFWTYHTGYNMREHDYRPHTLRNRENDFERGAKNKCMCFTYTDYNNRDIFVIVYCKITTCAYTPRHDLFCTKPKIRYYNTVVFLQHILQILTTLCDYYHTSCHGGLHMTHVIALLLVFVCDCVGVCTSGEHRRAHQRSRSITSRGHWAASSAGCGRVAIHARRWTSAAWAPISAASTRQAACRGDPASP